MNRLRLIALAFIVMVLLVPFTSQGYIGILYFRNLETGERNFTTYARPGDRIAINFDFETVFDEHWVELSGFINREGSTIVTPSVGTEIIEYINSHHNLPSKPYTVFTYGPDVVYDYKQNPGDSTKAKITDSGLYFRFNIDKTDPASKQGIYKIAEFVVPMDASPGDMLEWGRLHLVEPDAVSTRMIDHLGRHDALQYNRLVIVPEPAAVAGLAAGLMAIAAIARRKKPRAK